MISQTELQDLYEPSTFDHGVPLDLLRRCREQAAAVWIDESPTANWPGGAGFWLITRHAEVMRVLKNARLFSSWLGGTQLRDPATPEDLDYVRQMMLNMDPPEHTRLRRLLINSFTPSAVRRIEDGIRQNARDIVDRVLDQFADCECDFATDIAADMPLLSLADILGLPREDRYLMFDWANRVIGFQDPEYAGSDRFDPASGSDMARQALELRPQADGNGVLPNPRARDGMPDLYRYAHLLAEAKRETPQSDVVSILLQQVDDDGGQMSIEEFENMFWLFAVAGNETLRNGIPGGMIGLLQNPDAMQALREDRELIPVAVEEMLRWWTPVMIFRRTASADSEIDGAQIRAGDKVVVSFTSANRDERVYENAGDFDIRRDPNPHLALGYGPHFCLGAHLGKVQMICLFEELLDRFESIEPVGEPVFLRSNFQRGVKKLPIRFKPRRG